MAQAARPLAVCSRCLNHRSNSIASLIPSLRSFSTRASLLEPLQEPPSEVATEASTPTPTRPILDPNLVSTVSEEARLLKHQRLVPIGSRRRRAALTSSSNIPFEQLPYQCFQEARKVLAEDRAEKLAKIETQRARIARLLEQDASVSGGEANKQRRVDSMERELARLKILADINDPMVKKRFEDGMGDMNKPIYRYLADKKWRSYKRLITIQRITTMNVIPDVLPSIDPVVEVNIAFTGHIIPPGDFVYSRRSEYPPTVRIQSFDKEEKLVTIVAVDSDVPDLERDGFTYRCHGIWSNVAVTPTSGTIAVKELSQDKVGLPWLPTAAQKGSPYHRISLFVLEQAEGKTLDTKAIGEMVERDGFVLRSFVTKHRLTPIGVTMFRSEWDEGTAGVMRRANIPGADIAFKREKALKLPEKYRRKDGARYRGFR